MMTNFSMAAAARVTSHVRRIPSRDEAWDLFREWIESESLRRHCWRSRRRCARYARRRGEDEELWGVTGLLHDLDYERYPDPDDRPPAHGAAALRRAGYPDELIDAVAGHAATSACRASTPLARTLFAVDELSGFVAAVALVPPEGSTGMTPKSVKKKLKQPSFAAAVDRDEVRRGRRGARRRLRRAHRLGDRGAGGARRRARARARAGRSAPAG